MRYVMDKNELLVTYETEYFPQFQKPTVIGFYSVDQNRQFCPNANNLKYLNYDENEQIYDLNEGYEQYIGKPITMENEEKLNTFLMWLSREKQMHKFLASSSQSCYNFISYRGLLTTIMKTPYERRDDWLICATKMKNTVFLCAFYSDSKKNKIKQGQTDREKRFEYWGFKFEQYILSGSPQEKPNTSSPVNSNEEFCLIFRSRLNGKNLIYGAEVDGIESSNNIHQDISLDKLNKAKFVELKTSRHIQNYNQDRNFKKFKLISWWCQSFLVGIENVLCGFRDDQGFVHELKRYNVKDMPKISNNLWNANCCMQFLNNFLEFVIQTLKKEPNCAVWRFDYIPSCAKITRRKCESNEYAFLPPSFVHEFNLFN